MRCHAIVPRNGLDPVRDGKGKLHYRKTRERIWFKICYEGEWVQAAFVTLHGREQVVTRSFCGAWWSVISEHVQSCYTVLEWEEAK